MADEDTEQLVVLLEARIRDFEKNMEKASATATREFNQMRRSSRAATEGMQADATTSTGRINKALEATGAQIGVFSKRFAVGIIAPLAGLATLQAAINGTRNALDKLSEINDRSNAAGVDPEFFQEIAYQAKLSGVEIDGVAGALATFAKNAGLAAEGKGRMVATLGALNPQLLKSIQLATSQEERFRLVADAIKGAKDQAEAAAIATAAFGEQGVQIATAFKGGREEIDRVAAKARDLGLIIGRDLVGNADQLGDEFDTASQIVDTKLNSALVRLGPVLVGLKGLVADWLTDLSIVLDQINTVETRQYIRPLQNSLVDVENQMVPLRAQIADLKDQLGNLSADNPAYDATNFQLKMVEDDYNKLIGLAQQYQERIDQISGKPVTGWLPSYGTSTPAPPAQHGAGGDGVDNGRHGYGQSRFGLPSGDNLQVVADGLGKVGSKAAEVTRPIDTARVAVDTLAQSLEQTLGSAVSSLLDGPITSVDDALDRVLGSFASLGQQNLQNVFKGAFGSGDGQQDTPADGSWVNTATGFSHLLDKIPDSVGDGVFGGLTSFMKQNSANIGARLGGIGLGFNVEASR